jgi:hypothetical protein
MYNYVLNYDEYTFFKANISVSEYSYSRKFNKLYELKNTECSSCEIHLLIKIPKLKYMTKLRLKCRKNYNRWNIITTKEFKYGSSDTISDTRSDTISENSIDPFFCITDDHVLHYASRNDFYCKCQVMYDISLS